MIQQSLAIIPTPSKQRFNDLDYLAGTWTTNQALELENKIKSFETIDLQLWQ